MAGARPIESGTRCNLIMWGRMRPDRRRITITHAGKVKEEEEEEGGKEGAVQEAHGGKQ